jgi:hypothetical protein
MRKRLFYLGMVVSFIPILGLLESIHAAEFFCPAGNVTCLIAAINASNQNFQQNTINLEAGTYTLTTPDNETDGPNGLPSITGRITIRGQGNSQTAIERDSSFDPVFTGPPFRIFRIAPTGTLTLESLAVRRGFARLAGGIIFNRGNLTIVESDISEGITLPGDNGGGAIWNVGTLVVRSSRIFDNSAGEVAGGGIANEGTASIEDSFVFLNDAGDPSIGFGGGIYNTGDLNVARTNLVNNVAGLGGGLANFGRANLNRVFIWLNDAHDAEGGGIYNSAARFFLAPAPIGELNILSSTIAENIAETEGGGIFNFSGLVKITNSTIVRNVIFQPFLSSRGGGISNQDQLEIQNSIVALNNAPAAPDCSGSPLSLGRNIIGDTSGCLIILRQTDLQGDPGLGDLVVEDPPGRGYYPLLANSSAINSGNPDACPVTDQLGLPRVGNCDIGSVEFQGGRMVVSVDIRPKKDANRINPSSNKNVNVAIFSVNGFDATTVDSSTVRFGATGAEATPIHVRVTDVDGDGLRDMILRFQILDTGIKCGDTSAFLAGQIFGGQSFIGSSPLTTVQCKQEPPTFASRYFAQK